MEVLGQWQHGILYPRWAGLAHWGYGEARFLFYPPASWTLGAALGRILPWRMVPGAYCWIALTLAGLAMYRLTREWLRPSDALFAALLYAVNPYHLLVVYWRSAYAELLAAALLPLVPLCLLRMKERAVRPMLSLSLTLAAAWLTNAPAAIMIHYSTVALALIFAGHEAWRQRRNASPISGPRTSGLLFRTGLAIMLGAGLASFYLIPAAYEQHWVNLSQVLSSGVRPQDNFLFTNIADADHNRFNLLVSTLATVEIFFVLLAVWFARTRKPAQKTSTDSSRRSDLLDPCPADHFPWLAISLWALGSAFLMISVSSLFWQHLPKLEFVQLPFRWLLCLNAAFAILVTVAAKRWSVRFFVYAALLATLLIAGNRIQPTWWDQAADIREMRDAISDRTGYEGTDEYVPAGADPYDLNKELSLVSSETGAPIANQIVDWSAAEKHFKIQLPVAQNIVVRLFDYPAWQVTVNGKLSQTITTEDTRLLVIPVAEGESDIDIIFRRTRDRLIADLVSLLSIAIFAILWTEPAWLASRRPPVREETTESSAA